MRPSDRTASASKVEACLIGTVLCDPRLRSRCEKLLPSHFSDAAIGKLWREVMVAKYPDPVLLTHTMETSLVLPPPGYGGWGGYISDCLANPCPIDESVDEYVAVIRSEAALRGRRLL